MASVEQGPAPVHHVLPLAMTVGPGHAHGESRDLHATLKPLHPQGAHPAGTYAIDSEAATLLHHSMAGDSDALPLPFYGIPSAVCTFQLPGPHQ
jgi:hypothetical protein